MQGVGIYNICMDEIELTDEQLELDLTGDTGINFIEIFKNIIS